MKNYKKLIVERINKMPKGNVFVSSDFKDICSLETSNRIILRLYQDKKIKKVLRGIYYKSVYSKFLKDYTSPDIYEVAKAIARNYGWTIFPNGNTALNILGLSTQVPAIINYVSDGTYKTYFCGKIKIVFKKTANRNISRLSYISGLVIQALKALGKDNIDEVVINKLRRTLSKQDKNKIINESRSVASWIYEYIKLICRGDNNEKK